MALICGICHTTESKYRCPTCEIRYCSITCYKPHKQYHLNTQAPSHNNASELPTVPLSDRPGTKQRVPKQDFTGFEEDAEFKLLLKRYPLLKMQLQAAYALTLEPGPDEARSWYRQPLPGVQSSSPISKRGNFRGRGRGRADRGRGMRRRGGFGGHGGHDEMSEERQHGAWTQEKGDKEALLVLKKMKQAGEDEERAEGMREFVELCSMRFGDDAVANGNRDDFN